MIFPVPLQPPIPKQKCTQKTGRGQNVNATGREVEGKAGSEREREKERERERERERGVEGGRDPASVITGL